jgi:hypothetical protein
MLVDSVIPNPTKGRTIEYENKRKSSRKPYLGIAFH